MNTPTPVTTETLGDGLPKQMARVRDEVMPLYREIGSPGAIALLMMQHDLDFAAKAMMEGDIVKMLQAYESLKGYST